MVPVSPYNGVENLAAVNTSPSPERMPGSVVFLLDHPSLTPIAFHGNLLEGISEESESSFLVSPRESLFSEGKTGMLYSFTKQ